MKRVVFDTNVTISAFFWPGYPRIAYNLVKSGKIILLSSKKNEAEFIRVLNYPKFGLSSTEIAPLVNDFRRHINFVEVKNKVDIIKKDSTDNIFLECAIDGKADYIISGDHHLLNVGSYKGIKITKVKDFLIKEKLI